MSVVSVLRHLFHPQRSNNHRPRVLHPHAFTYLSLIALVFFGLVNSSLIKLDRFGYVLGFASNITPHQVVEFTNTERARLGLLPLTFNPKLATAAMAKGQDMINDQYWAHIGPDGKEPWSFIREAGYTYKVAGENLARDFYSTSEMMAAWMNSPTHKANIINGNYKEIGIAVIDGNLLGHETTLVVQMFGTQPTQVVQNKIPATTNNQTAQRGNPETISLTQPAPVANQIFSNPDQDLVQFVQATKPTALNEPAVLASVLVPRGDLSLPPLFSVLQLTKAFFLAMILMIVLTLIYDAVVIGHYKTTRLVGKNLAHIIFLTAVGFLLIFFKGGIVG